jgi:hypothetical protein
METVLGALVFAAFLLAQVAAVAAVRADGAGHGSDAFDGHAPLTPGLWGTSIAFAALFLSCNAYAQDLTGVAQQFLQRHGVPCQRVLKVGVPRDLGEVATCQDGRDWALFWLEDEIAFLQPQTGDAYKWDREIYRSHPELYAGPAPASESHVVLIYGP